MLLPPQVAQSSAPDLFGYGARGTAMVGSVLSTSRGQSSVYYNPSRLAHDPTPSFSVGFGYADFMLEIDDLPTTTRSAPALFLGLSLPLPFNGWLHNRLAIGLGFVLPQTSILIADIPQPTTPSFILLDNRAQTVSLQAALAFRPAPWFSIGGGVIALATLTGAVEVGPNAAGLLGSRVRNNLIADFAPVVGLTVTPLPRVAFAATYRGASHARFELPIEADLGDLADQVGLGGLDVEILPLPTLDISGTAQYDPEQLSIEVSGSPVPRLLLAAGFTWKRWSAFDNPIVYTTTTPETEPQPHPGFQDTFTGRLGAEWTADLEPVELSSRLGFAFEPTPTPSQTGFHNYLDNDRAIVGVGLGVTWRMLTVDIGAQWHHLVPARAVKEDPITDGHPGWPVITHHGEVVVLSTEVSVNL